MTPDMTPYGMKLDVGISTTKIHKNIPVILILWSLFIVHVFLSNVDREKNLFSNNKKSDLQFSYKKHHLTSPALSFSPIIFLCSDRWIIISGAKSIPVFPGTLYNMTGIGLVSATWNKGDNYKLYGCIDYSQTEKNIAKMIKTLYKITGVRVLYHTCT